MPSHEHPGEAATVRAGDARFQVLSPTLVRLEYASSGEFEDRPTFFAVNRGDGDPPAFETRTEDGWFELDTRALTLLYRIGSGPFTTANTQVVPADEDCPPGGVEFDQRLRGATDATRDGSVWLSTDRDGYFGDAHLAGFDAADAAATWELGPPPKDDEYALAVRYASGTGDGDAPHEFDLLVDSERRRTVDLPRSDGWTTARIPVELGEDESAVALARGGEPDADVLVDCCSLVGIGTTESDGDDALGGWYRDLDGQGGPVDLFDGVLSSRGWYLLDDSETALQTDDWVAPREREDLYQDGYLFGYGRDYEQGLRDLRALTGPAPLLPEWAFGLWYSRYFPYSADDYRETLVPQFRDEDVPLDVLVVDTDWKAPKIPGVKGAGASWSGWNWDTDLFPDPDEFMSWVDEQGLHTTFNVHPSVYERDPKFERADELAGGLPEGYCVGPDSVDCHVWDWADPDHAASYFSLHEDLEEQGVDFWWLDWLADASGVDMPGLTPDSWINKLYADRRRDRGERALAFSRIGAEYQTDGLGSPGPWADHRHTVHFTGDTHPTWEMLDFQTAFTVSEGAIGVPYVSHDVGSHTGGRLAPELYVRWVQAGAFQPVLRLHSVPGGHRLPWEYEGEARDTAAEFIRLRHRLIPYLYTVAREAHDTGLPMTRAMYLANPDREAAYEHDRQYLLGDDVLVAPVGHPADRGDGADEEAFRVGERLNAEEASLDGGAYSVAFYSGFSGASYVDGLDSDGASVTWSVEDVAADEYDLVVRYSNHIDEAGETPRDRTLTLSVDGENHRLSLAPTESWHDWGVHRTTVSLEDGTTELALRKADDDDGGVNVDFLAVVPASEDVPPAEPPEEVPPAQTEVWFPPGEWVDFFTGERFEGPATERVEMPLDRMPVYVRAGGVVPMQPSMNHVGERAVDPLTLRVFVGDDGSFDLYEDAGTGDAYRGDEYAWTPVTHEDDDTTVTIGPTDGSYPGQPTERGYRVEFVGADRPETVTVDGTLLDRVDADAGAEGWWYDGDENSLVVALDARPTDERVTVDVD